MSECDLNNRSVAGQTIGEKNRAVRDRVVDEGRARDILGPPVVEAVVCPHVVGPSPHIPPPRRHTTPAGPGRRGAEASRRGPRTAEGTPGTRAWSGTTAA